MKRFFALALTLFVLVAVMPLEVAQAAPRESATVTRVTFVNGAVYVEGYLSSPAYLLAASMTQVDKSTYIRVSSCCRRPYQGIMITMPFKRKFVPVLYSGVNYIYVNGRLWLTVRR